MGADRESSDDAPSRRRSLAAIGAAVAATIPGALLGAQAIFGSGLPGWPDPLLAVVFGIGVLGAAFMLAWAAETVQLDISAGLALSLLALIVVLPEYAVDGVFAIKGGNAFEQHGAACQPPGAEVRSPCDLALANMTGANRLLVGIGWPLVVLVAVLARRRRDDADGERTDVEMPRTGATEVAFLGLASVYALSLPLRDTITLIDAAVLVTIYGLYTLRISKAPQEEPELLGPSAWLGELPRRRRRIVLGAMFAWAAIAVLLIAEHFAETLVGTGVTLGISEFFLVQWVAPLASESPELVVAALYAWRLATTDSLGTLVASKVNQWTLLVGTLPILFAIAAGAFAGLPIGGQQRLELLLTAAQALFAVTLLIDLRLDLRNAVALFALFAAQFVLDLFLPRGSDLGLIGLSVVYLVGAVVVLWRRRRRVPRLLRDGFRTPYDELVDAPART